MPNDRSANTVEPSKVDTAASDACTRSGVFALLLSTALLLLIPPWLNRPNQVALSRYIALKNMLAMRVDSLDLDPIWQQYKASHTTAELAPIADLADIDVLVTITSNGRISIPPNGTEPNRGKPNPSGVPSAPTLQSAIASATAPMKLRNISDIRDYLIELDDSTA